MNMLLAQENYQIQDKTYDDKGLVVSITDTQCKAGQHKILTIPWAIYNACGRHLFDSDIRNYIHSQGGLEAAGAVKMAADGEIIKD